MGLISAVVPHRGHVPAFSSAVITVDASMDFPDLATQFWFRVHLSNGADPRNLKIKTSFSKIDLSDNSCSMDVPRILATDIAGFERPSCNNRIINIRPFFFKSDHSESVMETMVPKVSKMPYASEAHARNIKQV